MKAIVWYGRKEMRMELPPDPTPRSGEVKLKIKSCGICGSDVHEYYEGPFLIPAKPHPLTGRSLGPVIMGHEFCGEVVEVGPDVTGVALGDRVVVNPLIYCGECHYCKKGLHIMCLKLGTYGFAADGAFAEYGVFPARSLVKVPPNVSDEEAAFAEPVAVAVHAVLRGRMNLGDTVGVVGGGPIGLLVTQVALAAGAKEVFVVEPIKGRREIAEGLGARAVLNPEERDVGREIAALTKGLRADVVFDCVGSQGSFDTAVAMSGRRGKVCVVGMSLVPIAVQFFRLWTHEKEIVFSSGYEDDFEAALALIASGRIRVRDLITDRVGLEGVVEALTKVKEDPGAHVKIMVIPEG